MAQEVQAVMPEAVTLGSDGKLRVFYDKLGVKFETYDQWLPRAHTFRQVRRFNTEAEPSARASTARCSRNGIKQAGAAMQAPLPLR